MDLRHLFLSFEGRTRRLHFWLGWILLWVIDGVVWSATVGGQISGAALRGNPRAIMTAVSGTGVIGLIVFLLLLWPALAVQVKRWHDRDKTAWMVLINFIPIVGFFWTLIECGLMDGTPGPNRYGPSPKGLGGPPP
jgi:uncharacterized membrane protein YhaH (DUF805 family)